MTLNSDTRSQHLARPRNDAVVHIGLDLGGNWKARVRQIGTVDPVSPLQTHIFAGVGKPDHFQVPGQCAEVLPGHVLEGAWDTSFS